MRILLASDLDGTLIFDNKVSDENKEAIQKFKEEEGVFVVSTGRPFNGVEKVMKDLNIKTFTEHMYVAHYLYLTHYLQSTYLKS